MAKHESDRGNDFGGVINCTYCEGSKFHFGKECGACDGSGQLKVQKALDNVYRAKNNLPLRERKLKK
jgi:DnaJ-class molecular chaperone